MAERVGDQGGVRVATTGGDPLERQAALIEARVRQLQAAQSRGRWQLVLLALVIVVMFGIFTLSTTRRVRANLQEERLREAVVARVPDVRPDFERHMTDVARDVMPVYREQAVQRFRVVGPEVARAAIDRLKTLPQTSGQQLKEHLHTSHERVLARIAPEVTARYPSLSDERKKALLATYFHDKVEVENRKLADKINTMNTNEAIRVQAVLEKFGVADAPPAAPGEREREFLHALVDVLMDSPMTGYGTAVQTASFTTKVQMMPGMSNLPTTAPADEAATTAPTTGPAAAPAAATTAPTASAAGGR